MEVFKKIGFFLLAAISAFILASIAIAAKALGGIVGFIFSHFVDGFKGQADAVNEYFEYLDRKTD